jgi:hypothetical protein
MPAERVKLSEVVATAALTLPGRQETDLPLIHLACLYADQIDKARAADRGDVLTDIGPKLQSALAELGMTPAARARATKGTAPAASGDQAAAKLDQLRERRDARRAAAGGPP